MDWSIYAPCRIILLRGEKLKVGNRIKETTTPSKPLGGKSTRSSKIFLGFLLYLIFVGLCSSDFNNFNDFSLGTRTASFALAWVWFKDTQGDWK